MNRSSSSALTVVLVMLAVPTLFCMGAVGFVFSCPEVFLGREGGSRDGSYAMAMMFDVAPKAAVISTGIGVLLASIFSFLYVLLRKK